MNEENTKNNSYTKAVILSVLLIISILIFLYFPRLNVNSHPGINIACRNNLKQFGLIFYMYALDNSNTYPTSDKWCDLVIPYIPRGNKKVFICPFGQEAKCHYAINPDCEPNSPPDTILLFETKGGWNLSGGPELLTTENHSSKTCNVLFNDGSVGNIRKEEIPNLNWNDEEEKND